MLRSKNILIMLFAAVIVASSANAQTLLWSDEFDGTSLDLAKWVVWDEQDWRQGREVSMFRPYNVEVSDGTLKLYNQEESPYSWSGAHIDALYYPQYKYLEARIRHSAPDTYIWATWWTVGWTGSTWQWPPEFDICEFYGQPDESPGQWYHWGSGGGDYDGSLTGMDETQWHTYGVYWSETQSPIFYVDGVISSVPGGDPTVAHMAALLKLTTSPNRDTHYSGCPLATMEVDYVRVYDVPPDQPPPPEHLALNKPADASSEENESLGADKAVDGIDVSRWASAWSEPQWLRVDLEAVYSIDTVKIHWQYASAIEYKVQIADDPDGPWTDCVHITNNTAYDHWDNLVFPAQTGRYVRVYCIQRITEWGFSIWELEVYGSSDCGDETCDPGEDQCNCPEDCGTPPSTETSCTDGDDNDCDTYTDCDDSDCDTDPACIESYCGDETCDTGEDQCNCPDDCGSPPSTETNCTDEVDNDCDTYTDCDDPDCEGDPACPDCLPKGAACTENAECCSGRCLPNGKCQ